MTTIADRRARFRALHQSGCFAIPNPWDGGSAQRLEQAGFQALASTSAGAAWALGLMAAGEGGGGWSRSRHQGPPYGSNGRRLDAGQNGQGMAPAS